MARRILVSLSFLAGCGARLALDVPQPTTTPPSVRVVFLGLGLDHGCAELEDGTLWCWTTSSSATPVRVVGLP